MFCIFPFRVLISDVKELLVSVWCITFKCLYIVWNTSLVWYITCRCLDSKHSYSRLAYNSPCLDIGWITSSRVLYINFLCWDIESNTSPSVWYITSRCLDIWWNTSTRVWKITSRSWISDDGWWMKHSLSWLIYFSSVIRHRIQFMFDIILLEYSI